MAEIAQPEMVELTEVAVRSDREMLVACEERLAATIAKSLDHLESQGWGGPGESTITAWCLVRAELRAAGMEFHNA